MKAMIVLLLIGLGLCFGSFVNAFVFRLHAGKDWVRERSACLSCHHTLAPYDLVPVFSWLYLRGKCRYCHKPIPDTPVAELAVPTLFVLSFLVWPAPLVGVELLRFGIWLVCIIAFVALAMYDLRWYLLPDKIVFPLIGLSAIGVLVAALWTGNWSQAGLSVVSAAILSGLFLFLYHVSKGSWIGFGDVKLAIALGLLAGAPLNAMLLLLVASLAGTFIALPLIVRGKAGGKTQLPFGPLLIIGTIVVVLWGQTIIDWYLNLLTL
ncbi:MAG TPA: prepilin peptidase [Candidatus Saccharimonadales bacterium]|nr:prepilin peptidase [Candidatus Saccharimonadales bacterium]